MNHLLMIETHEIFIQTFPNKTYMQKKNHSVPKMISHWTRVNSKTFHHLVYCLAENSRKVKLMVIIASVASYSTRAEGLIF